MKTRFLFFFALLLAAPCVPAADELAETLQRGLFEEEANHNLNAAIKAYEAVVARTDEQRRLAATAVFRLGECYRKLGKTNEAVAQYERVLRQFSDQTKLGEFSQQMLGQLGRVAAPVTGVSQRPGLQTAKLAEAREEHTRARDLLERLKHMEGSDIKKMLPTLVPDPLLNTLLERALTAEQKLAEAKAAFGDLHPDVKGAVAVVKTIQEQLDERVNVVLRGLEEKERAAQATVVRLEKDAAAELFASSQGRQAQRRLLDEQIRLAEVEITTGRRQFEAGVISQSELNRKQRDVLELKRQLAALEDAPAPAPPTVILSAEQRTLLEEQIRLVEVDITRAREMIAQKQLAENGLTPHLKKLFELKQMLASAAPGTAAASTPATSEEAQEVQRIQALIKDSPDLINANKGGGTPLFHAAQRGQLVVAEFLLVNHADTEAKGSMGDESVTPLQVAAEHGHKRMVELLLSRGADIRGTSSESKFTALHFAAARGYRGICETLVASNAPVNARGSGDFTPLYVAAREGHKSVVQLLLAQGADTTLLSGNDSGRTKYPYPPNCEGTPLHIAVGNGHREIVEMLLAAKVNVNATNRQGHMPLHYASAGSASVNLERSKQIAQLLMQAGADINALTTGESRSGWTPLHYATVIGTDVAELLLEKGADPNLATATFNEGSTFHGCTPLTLAVLKGRPEFVELLLKFKADPDKRGATNHSTALQIATRDHQFEIARRLVESGANPNTRGNDGNTPLHYLVNAVGGSQRGFGAIPPQMTFNVGAEGTLVTAASPPPDPPDEKVLALARVLIERKADVNARNKQGLTPLNLLGIPAKPSGPTQTALAALLKQHGAVDELTDLEPHPDSIRVWRKSHPTGREVFARNNIWENRFTLLEALTVLYGQQRSRDWRPGLNDGSYDFPNLKNIRIRRLNADRSYRVLSVNLLSDDGRIECTNDVTLEFGDVVEIPEREHSLGEEPIALLPALREQAILCRTFEVKLVVKGQATNIAVFPGHERFLRTAMYALHTRQLLFASSDMSRVSVKRLARAGKPGNEFILDVRDNRGDNALFLEEGDVIEVFDQNAAFPRAGLPVLPPSMAPGERRLIPTLPKP